MWISMVEGLVRYPILSHCAITAVILLVMVPLLRRLGVKGYAWHAASYASLYLFAREALEAEKALKPILGDPQAYLWTLSPLNWTSGGNVWEWLVPSLLGYLVATLLPLDPGVRITGQRRRDAEGADEASALSRTPTL